MPIWLYEIRPLYAALMLVVLIESFSMIGLFLVRRFVISRLRYHDSVNDAVSGTVQAIGVFYGITVGLIAVGVWNTNSNASDLVSREATSIGALYRDVSGYPQPIRNELQSRLREYTVFVIEKAWPAQQEGHGQSLGGGATIMDEFQAKLFAFEPTTSSQVALHSETLAAYNQLIEYRRLRIDAVDNGLSGVMWAVIWVGAVISIGVAYFYRIEDWRIHWILIAMMAGFLAMLLFMIVINDRPFYGYVSVSSNPYKLILDRLIDSSK
ncbi:MAG TPA: hypothetical protein VGJ66_10645 [Pyrinomonadaceae bacterium]|jgi:hypothetical protein